MIRDHVGFALPQSRFGQDQALSNKDPGFDEDRFDQSLPLDVQPCEKDTEHKQGPHKGLGPSPLTPRTWQEAEKLAKLLCKTKIVPAGFENPDLCLIAILQGLEMGLPPMTALQRMALVEGKLTLWGDGALALVLKSGLCTEMTEWMGVSDPKKYSSNSEFEGDDTPVICKDLIFDPSIEKRPEDWVAFCEVRRVGWDQPIRRSFSSQDAIRANLWRKEGPWLDYPKRMLQMRARAFALRDAFADVLGGLYLKEEFESRSTPSRPVEKSLKLETINSDMNEKQNRADAKSNIQRDNADKTAIAVKICKVSNTDNTNKVGGDGKTFEGNINHYADKTGKFDKTLNINHFDQPPVETRQPSFAQPLPNRPQKLKAPAPWDEQVKRQRIDDNYDPNTLHNSPQQQILENPVKPPTQSNHPGHELSLGHRQPISHEDPLVCDQIHKQSSHLQKPIWTNFERPLKCDALRDSNGQRDIAAAILRRFQVAQRKCSRIDDLEACRLTFQPELDQLDSVDLDQAAQAYLEQEASIEQTSEIRHHRSSKRPRLHPQIRRWRAQYRSQSRKNIKPTGYRGVNQTDPKSEPHDTL